MAGYDVPDDRRCEAIVLYRTTQDGFRGRDTPRSGESTRRCGKSAAGGSNGLCRLHAKVESGLLAAGHSPLKRAS
jgi:hypothetical protein